MFTTMRTTCTLFTALALFGTLAVRPTVAKDDPLQLIHLLQNEGYPDVAIDYLQELKKDPNAPKDVMELWDLEMAKSMKEAYRQGRAYDSAQAKKWAEESKTLLEQFVKANPNRPEAIQEAARQAEEKALEGQYAAIRAAYTTDKEEKAKLYAKARGLFEEIRPRFVEAWKSSINLRKSLGNRARRDKIVEATIMVGENRMTVAMVDFYLAFTLPPGGERTAALTKCIKEFDAIYQAFRETQIVGKAFVGWRAHFWHGRICQELGQLSDAKAIYEEVAAHDERNISDINETKLATQAKERKATGFEDFFADVEQYYLQALWLLSDKKVCKEYLDEAGSWRKAHKANSERCPGYQALTLELAKNLATISEHAKSEADKKDDIRLALALLGQMKKVPSPYQEDAVKFRRQLNPNASADESFEDAVIDGDAALEKRDLASATKFYEKALESVGKSTDPARLAGVQNMVVACYHNQANQLYLKGKLDEALEIAKKGLKTADLRKTTAAPGLAVFMMNVQYYQYLQAPEAGEAEKTAKADLLAKVAKTANGILAKKEWAAKEDGDSARIVLMRLALAQEKMDEADKWLKEINPASKEYSKALTVMGFAHWYRYKQARKHLDAETKPETAEQRKDRADLMAKCDADRKLALETTEQAVKALKDPNAAADAAIPETLRESQLLLAEIYKEGEDYKKAWELYKPLVDDILKDSSKPFNEVALRIVNGAGQACLQLGDLPNITNIANRLMEPVQDQPQINLMLLNFAKRLEIMRKRALSEGEAGDAAQGAEAKSKPLVDLEESVMINLSKRDKISPASMIWVVKTANNLGTDKSMEAAADLIEKIFDLSTNNQAIHDDAALVKAEVSLHALGASIQAKLGQFQKAKDQIEAVIQAHPRALEPRVSEAKILTEWAIQQPAKYGKAIAKWDTLRKKLEHASEKASAAKGPIKVDPKYDVILNEADCFYRWAEKNKGKDDAREAAKKGMDLIAPYLNLDENIRNPSDEYNELSVRYFQLGGKLAKFLGLAKPLRPRAKRR